jgi:GNAT superfamily N-acetyltransferase
MNLSELNVVPLGDHDRASFTCGKGVLDSYLKTQANQDRKRNLARSYVLVHPDTPQAIIGYYSLAALSLDLSLLSAETAKGLPYPVVPCVLIGRLALDARYQGQGLGAFLLDRALRHCYALANQMGVFAVVVDALDPAAQRFYEKQGFRLLETSAKRLYVTMKAVAQSLG